MKNKKRIASVVLSATLLTSFLGSSGALASEKTASSTPVAMKVTVHKGVQNAIKSQNVPVKTVATANGNFQTQGAVSWTYKAFKLALRSGGWVLSQMLRPLSPKTAAWVRKNSAKVAKLMDKGEKWTENQFYNGLRGIGCPPDVARALAKFIITLI
ncbi:hypothetical protein [Bacillus haynesii]|uniref:hypothetical protein n=1 Tax=Bacillus haynesii TaxID=1925021 RepID=UPI0015937272|nr:hypothetical protein [Bacillus haynesii]NVB32587.1 hypothetical protein [Bacillus licheniformis]MCY7778437.1 hypothetical protein [Bacillus haynesii]MCY8371162.1 hypothetical protein [Bacillus haynesii]MEC0669388.1 hypothetical protein [Bacillus haynesii]MEC1416864.1 hypothetical protein [Bacillus haynesii]